MAEPILNNTGNAVPSTDYRDLQDNMQVLDAVVSGTDETVIDRTGTPRRTLAGYETMATGVPAVEAALAALSAKEASEAARDAAEDSVQYDYIVDDDDALFALSGAVDGQRAFVRESEHVWGYVGAAWSDFGLSPVASKADKFSTLFSLASADRKIQDALAVVKIEYAEVLGVVSNDVFAAVSNRVEYGAAEAPFGAMINTFRFWMEKIRSIGDITLTVYRRVQGGASELPPTSNDTPLCEVVVHGHDVASSDEFQWIEFRLPFPVTATGSDLLVWKLSAGGNLSIGRKSNASSSTQYRRGWFRNSGGGSELILPPNQLAYSAFFRKVSSLLEPRVDAIESGNGNFLINRYQAMFDVDGLGVSISGNYYGIDGKTTISKNIYVDPAASGTHSVENYNLLYFIGNEYWTSNPNAWLGRRHISNVSVVRSSDLTSLVAGVDYVVHKNGKLRGIVNTAAYNVNVNFDYSRERYDIIQIDHISNDISIKKGVERDFDAIEYQPKADSGKSIIAYVYVVGEVIDVIDASRFCGDVIQRGAEPDWQYLLLHNKKSLRKVLGKVSRGEAIKVASYGDSIVSMQVGDPSYSANGTNRDRPESYLINYPADTLASIPLFDFGDGAGQAHVKISAPWKLVAALEKESGQAVTYLNFGRGGSTSDNTVHNGLWPARLQPVIDSGADILILHFGMNELGSVNTLGNIKSIAAQAKANGIDVVVMSVPRRNGFDGSDIVGWRKTNRALWQACIESQCAFAPQHWISENESLGGIGASLDSLGAAALYNHPGIVELDRYGDVLVRSVLG